MYGPERFPPDGPPRPDQLAQEYNPPMIARHLSSRLDFVGVQPFGCGSTLKRVLQHLYLIALSCLYCSAAARADDPLHVQIDRLIALQTPSYEKIAAPVASDEEFLRRAYLDLTGTIPPVAQAREFLANADPKKREQLIDKLLASPEYARHWQRVYDQMLMMRRSQKNVPVAEWEKFLRESFAANKPYDQLVREILSADGADKDHRGPARFYLDRDGEVNEITRDIARLFLGANLECAQCHNHPQIDDYKQDHYYGISAFFVRSFVMTDKEKRVVFAEKADGEVTFESVFDIRDKISKGPKSTGPKLFEAMVISEPKFEKPADAYVVAPNDKDKTLRPVPRFSRRAKLAEFIASADNRRFCRTGVNRLWGTMLGRGIVHPVDLDHRDNPPSHALLLALLTEEFATRGLDIKAMLREIALSQTYQRSSRAADPATTEKAPVDETYAQAIMKPLSPAQFAWAVLQATGEVDVQRTALGDKATEEALYGKLNSYENRFEQLFGGERGKPAEGFESTTEQVLFLANDSMMAGLLKPKPGNLTERVLKLPEDNYPAIADELYLSVLTRKPASEDVQDVQAYLSTATGDARAAAVQELIWALISSAEFRFNH